HLRVWALERRLECVRSFLGQLAHLLIELGCLQLLLLLDLLEHLLLHHELLLLHQLLIDQPLRHTRVETAAQPWRQAGAETTTGAVVALGESDVDRRAGRQNSTQRGENKRRLPRRGHESNSSKMGVL